MMSTAPTRPVRRARALTRTVILLLLLCLPVLVAARSDDRQKPINYQSAFSNFQDRPNGVNTLRGQVVITQGTIKATGDLAKLYMDADKQIDHVVLTGSQPKAHIEQLDDSGNLMTGDADTITYNYASGIAILTGHADARQAGRGEFHGDKLTYDTRQSLITGQSSSGGLVHGVIYPKTAPASHPALKPAAAASSPAPAASSGGAR